MSEVLAGHCWANHFPQIAAQANAPDALQRSLCRKFPDCPENEGDISHSNTIIAQATSSGHISPMRTAVQK